MNNDTVVHLSFIEITSILQLPETTLLDIIEHGILQPVTGNTTDTWLFEQQMISVLKKAVRLHQDLEINWQGIAMVLELLEQREQLQIENALLKQRLSRFIANEE
jgi:chaperone modulatory protein CbpM